MKARLSTLFWLLIAFIFDALTYSLLTITTIIFFIPSLLFKEVFDNYTKLIEKYIKRYRIKP